MFKNKYKNLIYFEEKEEKVSKVLNKVLEEVKTWEYILDTPEDLKELQELGKSCDAGSTAFIISTTEVYMKNGQGEWIKI